MFNKIFAEKIFTDEFLSRARHFDSHPSKPLFLSYKFNPLTSSRSNNIPDKLMPPVNSPCRLITRKVFYLVR